MGEADRLQAQPAIIVPVYNDWPSLHRLAEAIGGLSGPRPFLIVVDDGSSETGPDRATLARANLNGEILRLRPMSVISRRSQLASAGPSSGMSPLRSSSWMATAKIGRRT